MRLFAFTFGQQEKHSGTFFIKIALHKKATLFAFLHKGIEVSMVHNNG